MHIPICTECLADHLILPLLLVLLLLLLFLPAPRTPRPPAAQVVNTSVYHTWTSFLKEFRRHGGVLEAVPAECISSPVVNFFIHPHGQVEILSAQEQVLSPQYCCIGGYFPESSVPEAPLREVVEAIGKAAYAKQILGYCTVDFVVYRQNDQLHLWVVCNVPWCLQRLRSQWQWRSAASSYSSQLQAC